MNFSKSSLSIIARAVLISGLLISTSVSSQVFAQESLTDRPKLFDELIQCRSFTHDAERLACYDKKVGEVDVAQQSKELIVADRAAVEEAERGTFGLKLPRLKLFGDGTDEQITEIAQTVKSVRQLPRGQWFLVLNDGATWQQTDSTELSRYPKKGSSIVIKRAAMGSFLAKVDDGRVFRIKRVVN